MPCPAPGDKIEIHWTKQCLFAPLCSHSKSPFFWFDHFNYWWDLAAASEMAGVLLSYQTKSIITACLLTIQKYGAYGKFKIILWYHNSAFLVLFIVSNSVNWTESLFWHCVQSLGRQNVVLWNPKKKTTTNMSGDGKESRSHLVS